MKTLARVSLFIFLSGFAMTTSAATECDSQAKPALSCPTGYSVMCIPVGTPHWGCGTESSDGQIVEAAAAKAVLEIEGRSIPENSIVAPVSSTITVGGDLVVESGSTVVGKPFILDGTKSQDDGVIHTFVWKQVSGPIAKLSDPKALSLSVVPSVAGTYVFELVVTDATGLSSVSQRSTFTVDATGPAVRTKAPVSTGDPDFDLVKTAPAAPVVRDVRDGTVDGVVPAILPKGEVDHRNDSDVSAGKGMNAGDPDFDLLRIDIGANDLDAFRDEVASPDRKAGVIVRGWDPEKKEEILAHPEAATTSAALKVYVEAVALHDAAITSVTVKEGVAEIVSEESGKLLWFIPVTMTSRVTIDLKIKDSTSDPVSVRLPWWHIFVSGVSPRDLDTELSTALEGAVWAKVDNSEAPTASAHAAFRLKTVSNVLKTKHDTAKNSIGNVR